MADICIPQAVPGAGGVGGGQGHQGQASQDASGHASRSYGIPVIRTSTGVHADFQIQLTSDVQGTIPAELYDTPRIDFVCLAQNKSCEPVFFVPCQYIGGGKIKLRLGPREVDDRQGLHYAQFHCYDDLRRLRHVFKCCLQIQRSLAGHGKRKFRPLTIAQVRMQVYDTSGQQNELLDDLEFSDVVIARCMERAVQDWNQMPPRLSRDLSVSNFPFKSNLCTGASGYLFRMASYRYMRNQMRHSNGGLTMDDNDKGQMYMQLAANALQEWKNWVQVKKSQINMMQCMGSTSDIYMESTEFWWH